MINQKSSSCTFYQKKTNKEDLEQFTEEKFRKIVLKAKTSQSNRNENESKELNHLSIVRIQPLDNFSRIKISKILL